MFKVVIIGSGSIAGTYAQALENSEFVKITAVLGVEAENTKNFAKKYNINFYTDADEMYSAEKPDAVLVCTPTFTHETIVKKAIENGVHVMCEKPFVLDADIAQQIFDNAKENNVRIMIMQVVRFGPEYVRIKQLIQRGELGEIKNVYTNRLSAHPDWCTWHRDPAKSGGGLYDLHIHDIDFLVYVFGKVKSVYAVGSQENTGCWNNVSATINFECGVSAVSEGFMNITGEWDFSTNVRVNGTKAAIEYLNKTVYNSKANKDKINNLVIYHRDSDTKIETVEQYNPYKAETEYFADCVINDKETKAVPSSDVVYVLRIVKAIEKSLQSGLVQPLE